MDTNRHWVGTWATAPAPSEAGVVFNNQTVRMHPRISIGGDTMRVRGKTVPLRSGLTLTADIVTERKTVLSVLLEPFRRLGGK